MAAGTRVKLQHHTIQIRFGKTVASVKGVQEGEVRASFHLIPLLVSLVNAVPLLRTTLLVTGIDITHLFMWRRYFCCLACDVA